MSDSFDARITAAILGSGKVLATVANISAIIAGVGCWYSGEKRISYLVLLSLTSWLMQSYFAVRVAIEGDLFLALSHGDSRDPAVLDALLIQWKLKRNTNKTSLSERTHGALRLWRLQRYSLILQVLFLAASLILRTLQTR